MPYRASRQDRQARDRRSFDRRRRGHRVPDGEYTTSRDQDREGAGIGARPGGGRGRVGEGHADEILIGAAIGRRPRDGIGSSMDARRKAGTLPRHDGWNGRVGQAARPVLVRRSVHTDSRCSSATRRHPGQGAACSRTSEDGRCGRGVHRLHRVRAAQQELSQRAPPRDGDCRHSGVDRSRLTAIATARTTRSATTERRRGGSRTARGGSRQGQSQ